MKICPHCKAEKEQREFAKKSSYCIPCNRKLAAERGKRYRQKSRNLYQATRERYLLRSQYGITPEQYQEKFDRQGGLCAICRKAEASKLYGKVKRLSIDHQHLPNGQRGKVRDLLCSRCNTALGHVGDDVKILKKMIMYLKEFQQ